MAQLSEWVSVSEAVRLSGLSTRTLKRMAEEGRIKFSRSPGGHVRIARAALNGLLRPANASVPAASSVLENRKERVEELVLESQELRVKRDLDRQREEDADRERQRAEARRAEAVARELVLRQSRAERKRDAERRERERREAEESQRKAAFEKRWIQFGRDRLAVPALSWLTFEQHSQVLGIVADEVATLGPEDEEIMADVLTETVARVIVPWSLARGAEATRARLIEQSVWRELPACANDQEKARAVVSARAAIADFPLTAVEWELRARLAEALEPHRKAIEERNAEEWRAVHEKIDSIVRQRA